MLRSFARRGGILLAALALPMLLIGNAVATTPSAAKLASATINGSGSTFQYGFNQVVIGGFKQQQPSVTVNYPSVGSGQGRTDFTNQVTDFGGTDATYTSKDPQPPEPFFYFPTVVAPITVSYNLPGVKGSSSRRETISKIFQATITTWDDAGDQGRQPEGQAPEHAITVAHRSDSSGNDGRTSPSSSPRRARQGWTLGTGSTVNWPADTQGGNGNSGVAKHREGHRRRDRLRRLLGRQRDRSDVRLDQEPARQVRHADACGHDGCGAGCAAQCRPDVRPASYADGPTRIRSPLRRGSSCTRTRPTRRRARAQGVPELHLRRRSEVRLDGRLRAVSEGVAQDGQGEGQQDHGPGVVISGRVVHGTGCPPPVPSPACDTSILVDSGIPHGQRSLRPDDRPRRTPPRGRLGPRPPGRITDRVFRWVALASGLLVLVILALITSRRRTSPGRGSSRRGPRCLRGHLGPVGGPVRRLGLIYGTLPRRRHRAAALGAREHRHRAVRHRGRAAAAAPSDRLHDRPARRDAFGRLRALGRSACSPSRWPTSTRPSRTRRRASRSSATSSPIPVRPG